ncbi:MAG: hypothetical protein HYY06_27235 [Deltaproteobacteria bacterium]|nr:hypothetical protein [Deltaproteobacteria bacterium]
MLGLGFAMWLTASSVATDSSRLEREPVRDVHLRLAESIAEAHLVIEPRESTEANQALVALLAQVEQLGLLAELVTLVRDGQPVLSGESILLRLVLPARIYVGWSF